MSILIERDNMISVHFDSILELMDYRPSYNLNDYKTYLGKKPNNNLGPTNKCGKDAIEHALLGDEKLYKDYLSKQVESLDKSTGYYTTDYSQTIKKVKRKIKYSDFGDEIDIHKVYRGDLNTAWRKTKRIEVDSAHHLVTLLVDIGGSWTEDASASLWRAAVVVKLVRDLEQAGKSVKVVVGNLTRDVTRSSKDVSTSITVKEYNTSLPLERLAAMCHLGFRRSAGFACTVCVEEPVVYSLGSPSHITHDRMPWHLKDEEDAGRTKFVIINRANSKSAAIDSLNNAYNQMKEFSNYEE